MPAVVEGGISDILQAKYEVLERDGSNCRVLTQFIKNSFAPSTEGKSIICSYPPDLDTIEKIAATDSSDRFANCTGDLKAEILGSEGISANPECNLKIAEATTSVTLGTNKDYCFTGNPVRRW